MNGTNPWTLVAIAMALVLVTSMIIAVVAWTTTDVEWRVEAPIAEPMKAASFRMGAVASQATAMSPPPPYALAACRRQASQLQPEDASRPESLRAEVVGGGSVQPSDPRYREAYARCMRSRGYSH
jgi:hypothetical protein